MNFKSKVARDPTGFLVPSTSLALHTWKLHTDESVRSIVERLAYVAEHGTAGQLKELQTLFGYKHSAKSLLRDHELNIPMMSVWAWDWMHCYMIDGVFVNEFRELFHRFSAFGLGGATFDTYLQAWVWPKGLQLQMWPLLL